MGFIGVLTSWKVAKYLFINNFKSLKYRNTNLWVIIFLKILMGIEFERSWPVGLHIFIFRVIALQSIIIRFILFLLIRLEISALLKNTVLFT